MNPPIAATKPRHAAPYSPVEDHHLAHKHAGYEGSHAFRGRHSLVYDVFDEEVADALWHIYAAPRMPWPKHRAAESS